MWSPIWRVLLVFQNTLFSYLDLTRTLWNCVTGISLYFTHEETEARMWMMCPYCLTVGLHKFILAFTVYNDSLFLTSSPAFVLCHTTLLNLFISSERFFLFFFFFALFRFFYVWDHVICKQRQLYFCLSGVDPFFFLPDFSGYTFQDCVE